jgi:AhpD family alkylhydroperoxidase
MTPRLSYLRTAPEGMQALGQVSAYVKQALDPELLELVNIRASLINGCSYCIALHVNDAIKLGISDDRIHLLRAWRETDLYSDRERAALALTEAIHLHRGRSGVR